eukprot:6586363-Prymnesium_polylepis.1
MTVARLACDGFTTEERDFPIFGGRRGDLRTSCCGGAHRASVYFGVMLTRSCSERACVIARTKN